MERKRKGFLGEIVITAACVFLLTLYSCSRNSGQVTPKYIDSPEQRETLRMVLKYLRQERQHERCLSTDISEPNSTDTCFACHDKIKR